MINKGEIISKTNQRENNVKINSNQLSFTNNMEDLINNELTITTKKVIIQ